MTQSFRPIPDNLTRGLVAIAPNIWTVEAKECVCYRPPMQPRYPYTHRAIVIRLNDNSLFVISPIHLTPDLRAEMDALGTVKYIVSPNHLHHLHMGDWNQAYSDAKLYASPRLPSKRKDLTFYKTLSTNTPEPEWAGQIDQCVEGKQQVAGFLDSAFDWLAPKSAIVESVMTIVRLLTLFLIVLPIHAFIVLIADIITPELMNWGRSN